MHHTAYSSRCCAFSWKLFALCHYMQFKQHTTSQNKTWGLLSMWLLYTISTFYWHWVICQPRVSTGWLCRALVSASCVLPAGLLTRWVSECVVGAPSVLCEGPLMGPKPQRSELQKLDHKVDGLQAELRQSHMYEFSAHTGALMNIHCLLRGRECVLHTCWHACHIFTPSWRKADLSRGRNVFPINREINTRKCDFI